MSKLTKISSKTLKKYMKLIKAKVILKIKSKLDKAGTFGLIMDGWSQDSEHFLSIFASFMEDGFVREPLLSCCVQEDISDEVAFDQVHQADEDKVFGLTAADMFDIIMAVLTFDYDIQVPTGNFVEGIQQKEPINAFNCNKVLQYYGLDNCSTNRKLSNDSEVAMVGCKGHVLHLGVEEFIGPEERKNARGQITQQDSECRKLLKKTDKLMGELTTIKNSAKLRSKTDVTPQRMNKTRWSSKFNLALQWTLLREAIGQIDSFSDHVLNLIPTAGEHQYILTLLTHLKIFESVSKALQSGGTERKTLADARVLFDGLIKYVEEIDRNDPFYGASIDHLKTNHEIVNNPDFENGIIKIQNGQENALTREEKSAVRIFLKPVAPIVPEIQAEAPDQNGAGFAADLLRRAHEDKRRRLATSKYQDVTHVSPTTVINERLFSNCRVIMNHLRKNMDPDSLELLVFLKINSEYWRDAKIIDEIIAENRIEEDDEN